MGRRRTRRTPPRAAGPGSAHPKPERPRTAQAQPQPPTAADPSERWIALGAIVGSHGLRGELRVKLYNPDSPLLYELDEVGVAAQGQRRGYAVRGARAGSKAVLLQLEGVDSIDDAQALRGAELCVPRSWLPDPEPGTYYHVDLEGLPVRLRDGSPFGEVQRVCEYPAAHTLLVRAGASAVEVPMREPYLVSIDLDAGEIVVDHVDDLEPEPPSRGA